MHTLSITHHLPGYTEAAHSPVPGGDVDTEWRCVTLLLVIHGGKYLVCATDVQCGPMYEIYVW